MSYYIEYNPQKNKRYPMRKKQKNVFPLLLGLMLCLAAAYILMAYDIAGFSEKYFNALDTMALQLRNGTKIGQAITAYCTQLFNDVKLG